MRQIILIFMLFAFMNAIEVQEMKERKLATFNQINSLLANVVIPITNAIPYSYSALGTTFSFSAGGSGPNSIICSGLSLTDLELATTSVSSTETDLTITLSGLTISCKVPYSWNVQTFGVTTLSSSSGSFLTASVSNGGVTIVMDFASTNIQTAPLNAVTVKSCTSTLTLLPIVIDGLNSAEAFAASEAQTLLGTTINNALSGSSGAICTAIVSAANGYFSPLISSYNKWATPLLLPVAAPPSITIMEKNVAATLPAGVRLVSWADLTLLQQLNSAVLDPLGSSSASNPNSILGQLDGIIKGAVGSAGVQAATNALLFSGQSSNIGASLTLGTVQVLGLETLQTAKLLQLAPGSNYTLTSSLSWTYLEVIAVFGVTVTTTNNGKTATSTSQATISISLSNIAISIEAILGVNMDLILNDSIGSIVNNIVGCALSAVPVIQVVQLGVSVGSITGPTVTNLIDSGFTQLITQAITGFNLVQQSVLLKMVPQLANQYGVALLNNEIITVVNPLRSCPKYIPPVTTATTFPSLPLSTSAIYAFVLSKLNAYVSGGSLDFGKLMNMFLPSNPGAPNIPGSWGPIGTEANPIAVYQIPLGTAGTLNIAFTSLVMFGLNNFNAGTELLYPESDSLLHSEIFLGWNTNKVNFTLGVNLYITGGIFSQLHDDLGLSAGLENVHIQLNLTTDFNEASIYNSTLNTIINSPLCMLKAMQIWGFSELTATFGAGFMHFSCSNCSSPALEPIIKKMEALSNMNDFVDFMNNALYQTGSKGTGVFRNLMLWLDQVVYNAVNPLLSGMSCPPEMGNYQPQGMWSPVSMQQTSSGAVSQGGSAAPASSTPSPPGFQWPSGVTIIIIGVGLIQVFLAILYVIYVIRKKSKEKNNIITDQDYVGVPLCINSEIPIVIRIFMPLVLVFEFYLFYSAHTQTGASFDVYLNFAGETIPIQNFYQVTLAMTIQQALQSGSFALAVLVGVMSGVWPYIKIELMLFCWFCPPRFFGNVERAALLNTLDTLGKWSQVDLYVLVLLMVSFNLEIISPGGFNGVFEEGFISAHMQLDPQWGIYGFVLAVMIAILCNQLIVWYNRKCMRKKFHLEENFDEVKGGKDETERAAALFAHHFETKDGVNYVQYGAGGVFLVTCLIILCCACIIAGSTTHSLGYTYQGLVSAGMSWSNVNASIPNYSIITMTSVLSNQQGVNPYGLFFIQGSIYFFTLLAPLLFVFLIMILWMMRLTITNQEKLLYVTEIVRDWCCLDVYVVAYVVTLFEVGHLADYLGTYAAPICQFFGQLAYNGNNLICFGVQAYPEMPGIPIIVTSVILLWMLQAIVLRGTSMALRDRAPHEKFRSGHKPSSAFVESVVENNTGLRKSLYIAKFLPRTIITVGKVYEDSSGARRYTSTLGSVESFGEYVVRKATLTKNIEFEGMAPTNIQLKKLPPQKPPVNTKKTPSFNDKGSVELEVIEEHFDRNSVKMENPIKRLIDDDELSTKKALPSLPPKKKITPSLPKPNKAAKGFNPLEDDT